MTGEKLRDKVNRMHSQAAGLDSVRVCEAKAAPLWMWTLAANIWNSMGELAEELGFRRRLNSKRADPWEELWPDRLLRGAAPMIGKKTAKDHNR